MENMLVLPIVTVQSSFPTVISEVDSGLIPSDTFWVSCYKKSEPSVHAKVHVELDERDRSLVLLKPQDNKVEITKIGVRRAPCHP
jgi:proteasomal ATPase-associated factor 1